MSTTLLMRRKEQSKKTGLKLNIQKTKIMASNPITSSQIKGENLEALTDIFSLGSKITVDVDCSLEIKRHLLLRRKVMTNLVKVTQSCPTLCDLMDYTVHGILQARILKWVAFPLFLQGIFPTQGLNPGLLHCRRILYQLSHKGSP